MGSSINMADILRNLVLKWRVVLASGLAFALLGFLYSMTYSEDNDPYPYSASATCAVVLADGEGEASYSSRQSWLTTWVKPTLGSSELTMQTALSCMEIEAFADLTEDDAVSMVRSCVSASYATNTDTLSVRVVSDNEGDAKELLEVYIASLEAHLNELFSDELGSVSIQALSASTSANSASGVSTQQVVAFAFLGLFVGVVLAVVLVLMRDYVSFSSLLDRYGLPVYGPYMEGKKNSGKKMEAAYSGLPAKRAFVPVGEIGIDPEKILDGVSSGANDSKACYLVEIDDIREAFECGHSVLLVAINAKTSHHEVARTVRLLEAYGIKLEGICLLARKA